jgi:hypothetical protein
VAAQQVTSGLQMTSAQQSGAFAALHHGVTGQVVSLEAQRSLALADAARTYKGDPRDLRLAQANINQQYGTQITATLLAGQQEVANRQVTAANTQLQAAQIGVLNVKAQQQAFYAIEQATLAANAVTFKNDPKGLAVADAATKTVYGANMYNVGVQGLQRTFSDMQAHLQYNQSRGIVDTGLYQDTITWLRANAVKLNMTPYQEKLTELQLRPSGLPIIAPTFGARAFDPGLDAAAHQALFRVGRYQQDPQQQMIQILQRQIEYDQQALAQEREQNMTLKAMLAALQGKGAQPPHSSASVSASRTRGTR